jgi:hypothetical protein
LQPEPKAKVVILNMDFIEVPDQAHDSSPLDGTSNANCPCIEDCDEALTEIESVLGKQQHDLDEELLLEVSDAEDNSRDGESERDIIGEVINQEGGEDYKDWEEEVQETVAPIKDDKIQPWDELHIQIIADLKKQYRPLPLSKLNQLMILYNFANLHLKHYTRIQASLAISQQWHESDSSNTYFAHCSNHSLGTIKFLNSFPWK